MSHEVDVKINIEVECSVCGNSLEVLARAEEKFSLAKLEVSLCESCVTNRIAEAQEETKGD